MPSMDQGLDTDYYSIIPRSLIFITWGRHVLLIKGAKNKKRWANLYNGIGGHFKMGEDIYAGAQRELFEETGLDIPELWLCGIVTIDTGKKPGICIFIFRGVINNNDAPEIIVESEEGILDWILVEDISALPVVEDIPLLLPRVFESHRDLSPFIAHYSYDQGGQLKIRFID